MSVPEPLWRSTIDGEPVRSALGSTSSATPEDKLAFAAHHLGVATLGPAQAAALLARLAYLEAIEQRAREVIATSDDPTERFTAAHILGEDG